MTMEEMYKEVEVAMLETINAESEIDHTIGMIRLKAAWTEVFKAVDPEERVRIVSYNHAAMLGHIRSALAGKDIDDMFKIIMKEIGE